MRILCEPFPSVDLHALERLHLYNIITYASPNEYGIDHVTNIMYTHQLATSYI